LGFSSESATDSWLGWQLESSMAPVKGYLMATDSALAKARPEEWRWE